jgi:hypothetical protein
MKLKKKLSMIKDHNQKAMKSQRSRPLLMKDKLKSKKKSVGRLSNFRKKKMH